MKIIDPFCARCYAESASRAAQGLTNPAGRTVPGIADPDARIIMLRAARALIDLKGVTISAETHALHPRRMKPWPSGKAA